jgi:hypothetical protein
MQIKKINTNRTVRFLTGKNRGAEGSVNVYTVNPRLTRGDMSLERGAFGKSDLDELNEHLSLIFTLLHIKSKLDPVLN